MSESNKWYGMLALGLMALFFYLLGPVLMPFLIAGLLSYMGNPIVNSLARWRIPRTVSVAFLFVVFFCVFLLLILLIIPMIIDQLRWFIGKLPVMFAWLQEIAIPKLNQWLDVQIHLDLESVKKVILGHWQQASDVLASLLSTLTMSGAALLAGILNLILIPVVTFYLLRDWPRLWLKGQELLPRRVEPTIVSLVHECNLVLGAFLRGQLLVMFALGCIYTTGLSLLGLNVALLIGCIAGLLSFVPYLGLILGVTSACIAAFFQFNDLAHLGWVAGIFILGQLSETVILTPWLVGDRIGLHPISVIFAVLAGGQLFGFVGILIALPTAAVIVVLLRHLKHRYQASQLYTTESELRQ